MSKVRVCFFGTPEFAVTCLKSVFEDSHYEIVGVVTQPDRPAGRKLVLTPSPVKQFALANNLTVISPESVNKVPIRETIESWGAEVGIVVAFGQIMSSNLLKSFKLGCVNVHASLLPRWRGAAPIQRAIEAGDKETGVCLQVMVKELDAGDVIGERKLILDDQINSLELHDKLAVLGAELLKTELMDYVRGHLIPKPQNQNNVTYAKKIDKQESQIDWNQSAEVIHNKVRAFVWGPGVWALYGDKRLKIHKTSVCRDKNLIESINLKVGEFVKIESRIFTKCGEGVLEILELQPESRNKMQAKDFQI